MKTRTGFVSNSSSSSFIAVATLDAFEKALSMLESENERKIIRAIAQDDICFGQKVKVVKEFSDAGGFSSIWGNDSEDKDEILEKAGISDSCPNCDDDDEDAECTCDNDRDFVWDAVPNYTSALDDLATKKEWKDKIYQNDVGDGG